MRWTTTRLDNYDDLRTYEDWEPALLIDGKEEYTYGFLAQFICAAWNSHPFSASYHTLSAARYALRISGEVATLVQDMYRGPDAFPYLVHDDDRRIRRDPLLSEVVDLLVAFGVGSEQKALQVGLGEGRLGRHWSIRVTEPEAEEDLPALIAADYVPTSRTTIEKARRHVTTVLEKARQAFVVEENGKKTYKPIAHECYDANLAWLFDPYNGDAQVWYQLELLNAMARDTQPPRHKYVTVVEVFHEVGLSELGDFLIALDSVTAAGGYCLVEDVFYLPHSVERDFCLFRSDELGDMFRALRWDVWDVPCWTHSGAIPYSFVLARKPESVVDVSNVELRMSGLHAKVKARLCTRLKEIVDAWRYRAMFPNEIREHLYTLYGLSTLIRWETTIREVVAEDR